MIKRTEKIASALKAAFPNCEIHITDNSHLHAGHAGAQTGKGHFKLEIKAKELIGKNRVQQHQLIYQALNDLFETDIHALEIKTLQD